MRGTSHLSPSAEHNSSSQPNPKTNPNPNPNPAVHQGERQLPEPPGRKEHAGQASQVKSSTRLLLLTRLDSTRLDTTRLDLMCATGHLGAASQSAGHVPSTPTPRRTMVISPWRWVTLSLCTTRARAVGGLVNCVAGVDASRAAMWSSSSHTGWSYRLGRPPPEAEHAPPCPCGNCLA